MSSIIYFFGSELAFFVGIVLVLASLVAFIFSRQRWSKIVASLIAVIACLLIALSAAPLPYWFYALAGALTLVWLVAERTGWPPLRQTLLRTAVAVVWATGAALEMPQQFNPEVGVAGAATLYIIGDSVAAGASDQETGKWPQLLAKCRPVEVIDLSRMGATAASALHQAEKVSHDGVVLVEIGGNDVLGSTSAAKFEQDLDRLLRGICYPGRVVVMFELPLPPLCNEYGRVQRRLAVQYGVKLIPRRVLAEVLTGSAATLDSIHLSPKGHERMAEVIWAIIGPAFASRATEPR